MLPLLLSAALSAPAAPAPAERFVLVPRPAQMVGRWEMTWAGTIYEVELRPNGTSLITSAGGSVWRGLWWVDWRGRLHVLDEQDGAPCRHVAGPRLWVVTWAPGPVSVWRPAGVALYQDSRISIQLRRRR